MNTILDLLKVLVLRWQAESPKLFVRLQWISSIIGALISAVLILNTSFNWRLGLVLIAKIPLTLILTGIVTFLAGVFGASKITVANPDDLIPK